MKGHHTLQSEETKRLISAKKRANPTRYWLGKKRSTPWLNTPEANKKKSDHMTANNPMRRADVRALVSASKRRNPVRYWLGKTRPDMTGENHPMWRGGISTAYDKFKNSTGWKHWREAVFRRDEYTCQMCAAKSGHDYDGTVFIEPHHIFTVNDLITHNMTHHIFNVSNGITLCRPCHQLTIQY